jgi:hypothetical protein
MARNPQLREEDLRKYGYVEVVEGREPDLVDKALAFLLRTAPTSWRVGAVSAVLSGAWKVRAAEARHVAQLISAGAVTHVRLDETAFKVYRRALTTARQHPAELDRVHSLVEAALRDQDSRSVT